VIIHVFPMKLPEFWHPRGLKTIPSGWTGRPAASTKPTPINKTICFNNETCRSFLVHSRRIAIVLVLSRTLPADSLEAYETICTRSSPRLLYDLSERGSHQDSEWTWNRSQPLLNCVGWNGTTRWQPHSLPLSHSWLRWLCHILRLTWPLPKARQDTGHVLRQALLFRQLLTKCLHE